MANLNRRVFVGGSAAAGLASMFPGPACAAEETTNVTFADGSKAPRLGQGSWHMADGQHTPEAAQEAMRLGISLGLTLIDTAELYGEGRAQELIAKVIAGQRDSIFLVSKVMPVNATEDGIEHSLRESLRRLGTDHLDLYLMHWRRKSARALDLLPFLRGVDLKSAVNGFERARQQGLIKRWGVSNFSVDDMEKLLAVPSGEHCSTNQVLYNLNARGIEADLLPWCQKRNLPIMAYSPLGAGGTGKLLAEPTLKKMADARGVTSAAIALAWAMRGGSTIALVESGSTKHIREDAAALTLSLTKAELDALDKVFPPPRGG